MRIMFSVDLHDKDGDVTDECILLHLGDNVIIKVKNQSELQTMISSLKNVDEEITEQRLHSGLYM